MKQHEFNAPRKTSIRKYTLCQPAFFFKLNPAHLDYRMYLIKQVPKDSRKLEMCFDCNAFQYQLNHKSHPKDHVFQVCLYPVAAQNDKSADSDFVAGEQTIFLNKKHKDTWSIDEIKEEKISMSHLRPANSLCCSLFSVLFSSKGLVASVGALVE